MLTKIIYCPVNGWDCPYCKNHNGYVRCMCEHPEKECEDFQLFWDEGDDWFADETVDE